MKANFMLEGSEWQIVPVSLPEAFRLLLPLLSTSLSRGWRSRQARRSRGQVTSHRKLICPVKKMLLHCWADGLIQKTPGKKKETVKKLVNLQQYVACFHWIYVQKTTYFTTSGLQWTGERWLLQRKQVGRVNAAKTNGPNRSVSNTEPSRRPEFEPCVIQC